MVDHHRQAVTAFGIWFLGLFASGLLGAMTVQYFLGNPFDPANLAGVIGGIVGMSVFGSISLSCAPVSTA